MTRCSSSTRRTRRAFSGRTGRGFVRLARRQCRTSSPAHLRQGAGWRRRTCLSVPQVMRDFLLNSCRPFIFSTRPPPLIAGAALAKRSGFCKDEPQRREQLAQLVQPDAALQSTARCAVLRRAARKYCPSSSDRDRRATCASRPRCATAVRYPRQSGRRRCRKERRGCGLRYVERAMRASLIADLFDALAGELAGIASRDAALVVTGTDTGIGKTVFSARLWRGASTAIIGSRYKRGSTARPTADVSAPPVRSCARARILPEICRLRRRPRLIWRPRGSAIGLRPSTPMRTSRRRRRGRS